jgi:hypothetical protein
MAPHNKFKSGLISGLAPGYWGRDISCRIASEKLVDKVLSANLDKILAMGLPFAVWREASLTIDGLAQCSCFKDTSKQPDIPCMICYGTGKVPGYLKFGTQNYWKASTDAGWTLVNTELDKTNRPFRIHLTAAATSGTATSGDIAISVTSKTGDWEYAFNGFTRDGGAGSTISVEASKDSGASWFPLTSLNTELPTTTIRFRVTLSRNSVAVKSPMFEIVRVRFPTITDIKGELDEPVIRVIPTWDREQDMRTNHGTRIDTQGKRFWTMPLAFFDSSIPRDNNASKLMEDVMVEVRYGSNIGIRYAIVDMAYSDTFSSLTRMEFSIRRYSGEKDKLVGEYALRVF